MICWKTLSRRIPASLHFNSLDGGATMIETLTKVLEGALDRLHYQVTTYVPSLLAAFTLFLVAFVIARFARWLLYKIVKGQTIDRFLRQSGIAFIVDPSGRLRATSLVAESVYWCVLLTGVLAGLNVFGTDLASQINQRLVFLLPKVVVVGVILLAGAWLGRYLGRSVVVWAVGEGLPSPRRLGMAVRVLIMFVAVVVAADELDFARNVFLAAFIIIVGGAVLAASLAIGRRPERVGRLLDMDNGDGRGASERSMWSHQ